jgi:SAM-dependent methyltransferase
VDIRPLAARLPNLTNLYGDILHLPFANNRIASLSCLHVVEHIGLGRYGDPLNPQGTRQACQELVRVLAPGGNLYISTPIGQPRTCFNAHRIHAPAQFLGYFDGLRLIEFTAVNDQRRWITNGSPDEFEQAEYACGMFRLQK